MSFTQKQYYSVLKGSTETSLRKESFVSELSQQVPLKVYKSKGF